MAEVLRPEEKHAFEILLRFLPDFAGSRILEWEPAPSDPPDIICYDLDGRKIGVEIVRILKEEQTRRAIQHDQWSGSLDRLLRSEEVEPPNNFRLVLISMKENVAKVRSQDEKFFRDEFFRCVGETDQLYPAKQGWHGPQGFNLDDLSRYPTLSRYVTGISFSPGRAEPGAHWAIMWSLGSGCDPEWIVKRAEQLIQEKCNKCSGLVAPSGFDRVYCLTDYNWQAFFYNTPICARFREFAEAVRGRVRVLSTPFENIFLVNSIAGEEEVIPMVS